MSRSPVATRVTASGEELAPVVTGLVDDGDGDTDAQALRGALAAVGALASVAEHPPTATATRATSTPHVRARDPVTAAACPTGLLGVRPARPIIRNSSASTGPAAGRRRAR